MGVRASGALSLSLTCFSITDCLSAKTPWSPTNDRLCPPPPPPPSPCPRGSPPFPQDALSKQSRQEGRAADKIDDAMLRLTKAQDTFNRYLDKKAAKSSNTTSGGGAPGTPTAQAPLSLPGGVSLAPGPTGGVPLTPRTAFGSFLGVRPSVSTPAAPKPAFGGIFAPKPAAPAPNTEAGLKPSTGPTTASPRLTLSSFFATKPAAGATTGPKPLPLGGRHLLQQKAAATAATRSNPTAPKIFSGVQALLKKPFLSPRVHPESAPINPSTAPKSIFPPLVPPIITNAKAEAVRKVTDAAASRVAAEGDAVRKVSDAASIAIVRGSGVAAAEGEAVRKVSDAAAISLVQGSGILANAASHIPRAEAQAVRMVADATSTAIVQGSHMISAAASDAIRQVPAVMAQVPGQVANAVASIPGQVLSQVVGAAISQIPVVGPAIGTANNVVILTNTALSMANTGMTLAAKVGDKMANAISKSLDQEYVPAYVPSYTPGYIPSYQPSYEVTPRPSKADLVKSEVDLKLSLLPPELQAAIMQALGKGASSGGGGASGSSSAAAQANARSGAGQGR